MLLQDGLVPLHYAVKGQKTDVINALIDHGADFKMFRYEASLSYILFKLNQRLIIEGKITITLCSC